MFSLFLPLSSKRTQKTAKEITTAPQSPKQKTKTHHCALLTDDRSRSRQQVQNKTNLLRTSKNERTHNPKTFAFAVKERQKTKTNPKQMKKRERQWVQQQCTRGKWRLHSLWLILWYGLVWFISSPDIVVSWYEWVSLNSGYRGHFLWKRNAHECEPKKRKGDIKKKQNQKITRIA